MMQRQCTWSYKLEEIRKAVRAFCHIKRGQKDVSVTQWIGISWDEMMRMKPSRDAWCENRWPLIEKRMTRKHCLSWMQSHGFPTPPRSACVMCPFHSDAEWRRLRDEEPDEFRKAVEFEPKIQETMARTRRCYGVPFLHASLIPLGQVDFSTDVERGQGLLWNEECTGICGV